MAKAQELQDLARNSFGFGVAGDVFSTMIRLYAKHLDFLKTGPRNGPQNCRDHRHPGHAGHYHPGIGPTLGVYILSEIGDISRFYSSAKLAAYAGIDPTCGSPVNTTALGTACPNGAHRI